MSEERSRTATNEDAEGGVAHERQRRRVPVRILAVGLPVSLLLALGTGLLGAPGSLSGAVFLSLAALTVAVAGGAVSLGVVVDMFRGVRVPTRRVLLTGALLLVTLVLLVASAGAMVSAAQVLS